MEAEAMRRARRSAGLRALLLACAGVSAAALLAGCGSAKVDSGGFTASQFKAAEQALTFLGQTSVYDDALKTSDTEAEVPTTCTVHLEQKKPLMFKVFLTWIPNIADTGKGNLRAYSWVEAVLGPDGLKQNYSFHAGNEASEALLESKYGDAFDKPVEKCLLLQNRQFGLLPAS
jgi:hypothetical protein